MVFAINNPQVRLRNWYLDPKEMAGDTTHIVEAIKEHNIGIDEVVSMLKQVYEKVLEADKNPKLYGRSSNVASRFTTVIQKAVQ